MIIVFINYLDQTQALGLQNILSYKGYGTSYPLLIALSKAVEFGIALSKSVEYDINLTKIIEYNISLTEITKYVLNLAETTEYNIDLSKVGGGTK